MSATKALVILAPLLVLSASACSPNEVWTTPLAPPRAALPAACAVATTTGTPEGKVDNLASVRCHFTGVGASCVELARERACHIGGNLLYGLHYEENEYLVGTIGVIGEP